MLLNFVRTNVLHISGYHSIGLSTLERHRPQHHGISKLPVESRHREQILLRYNVVGGCGSYVFLSSCVEIGDASNAPSVRDRCMNCFRPQHELLNDKWKGFSQLVTAFSFISSGLPKFTRNGPLSYIQRQERLPGVAATFHAKVEPSCSTTTLLSLCPKKWTKVDCCK